MFSPQNVDTVQFSNEAFNDSSMMSFDNVLYGNLDDPVLMTPLEFPIDDKQSLPQVHLTELMHSFRSWFELSLNWRKHVSNSLLRKKNTKEIIIYHKGTSMVKDGKDWRGSLQNKNLKNLG